MNRILIGLATPVLALSLLAGCGGGEDTSAGDTPETSSPSSGETTEPGDAPSDDSTADAEGADTRYCELLDSDFAGMFAAMQGPEDVNRTIGLIRQVAAAAPAEVEDEWAVMESALGEMKSTLIRAARLQQQAERGEISKKELQRRTTRLMEDMQALDTPKNNKAGDVVSRHAVDYCGISLG